jgi:hypothetical protein
MSTAEKPRFPHAPAWFCTGNADERFTTLALENLLVELASTARSPLAVYTESPPFSTPPVRFDARDRLDRLFEHFTKAAIPAIRLGALEEIMLGGRVRERLSAEGSRFGAVLIRASSIPQEGLPVAADGIVFFLARGASTPGWVYRAARTLSAHGGNLPVCIVVLNAGHLEAAAAFYQETRDEVVSLLGKDIGFRFAGHLELDPDYVSAAVNAHQPLVTCFPGSPIHGQARYVLRAMSAAVSDPPAESFLQRMAARALHR